MELTSFHNEYRIRSNEVHHNAWGKLSASPRRIRSSFLTDLNDYYKRPQMVTVKIGGLQYGPYWDYPCKDKMLGTAEESLGVELSDKLAEEFSDLSIIMEFDIHLQDKYYKAENGEARELVRPYIMEFFDYMREDLRKNKEIIMKIDEGGIKNESSRKR